MPKEFSQFKGEGMKYAPKRKSKRRSKKGSSGSAASGGTQGTPNSIRSENQVRQDMKRHRSRVLRMGR